ncbi:MAG: hypothetical protein ACR2P7_01810 [bacterium]
MKSRIPPALFGALLVLGVLAAPAHSEGASLRMVHSMSGKCVYSASRVARTGSKLVVDVNRHKRACADTSQIELALYYDSLRKRIIHPYTKLCVVPVRGDAKPQRRTKLMLGNCNIAGAEFTIRSGKYIRHIGGQCVHILPGRGETWVTVNNGASVILDAACFGERTAWAFVDPRKKDSPPPARLVHKFSGLCAIPEDRASADNTVIKLVTHECDRQLAEIYFAHLPNGAIKHLHSGKCLHPLGGRTTPYDKTPLMLHSGCVQGNIRFRRLASGALQHEITGKCIQPLGRALVPDNYTALVLNKGCVGRELGFDFTPDS